MSATARSAARWRPRRIDRASSFLNSSKTRPGSRPAFFVASQESQAAPGGTKFRDAALGTARTPGGNHAVHTLYHRDHPAARRAADVAVLGQLGLLPVGRPRAGPA